MSSENEFAPHAVAVATEFWGAPNDRLSTKDKVCWGSQGSKAISVAKGTWFDYEQQVGGGVIALVMHEKGCAKDEAVKWLVEEGFLEGRGERQERGEAPRTVEPEHQQESEPEHHHVDPDDDGAKRVMVKGYVYTSRDGEPLYQVCRFQWKLPDGSFRLSKTGSIAKTFMQRRKVNGDYVWNLDGIGHTIYRHQQIELAIEAGRTIFIPEGEKDVDTLVALGLEATTNSGGAAHWAPELARLLRGADVVIPVDNDEPGRKAGQTKAASLKGIAKRVRVLDLATFWKEIGPKQDITDWFEAGGTLARLAEMIRNIPDWAPAAPPSSFGAIRMSDMATSKIVYDWLVKGLIERGGVFIVAGEKQAGKSFFVIDLGMKIARGLDYDINKGSPRKVAQGLVIHMATEDGKGVQMRAEGYRRDQGIPANEDIPFIVMSRNFSLMDDAAVDKFIAECLAWEAYYGIKLELIIIDTFSAATEGLDEIHSAEVSKVLARVKRIQERTQSAVCLVHHLNAKGDRVRGHSMITADLSQVIEIRQMHKFQTKRDMPLELIRDSDHRVVRQALLEKNKNGENALAWQFVLRKIDLGHDSDGFEISTCVIQPPSGREVSEEDQKGSKLSAQQRMVMDALRSAIDNHGILMPAGVAVGPQIKLAAPETAFVSALRKSWSFSSPDPEAQKKELGDVLKRTTTALITAGYMGRDNDKKIIWSLNKDDRRQAARSPDEQSRPSPPTESLEAPF